MNISDKIKSLSPEAIPNVEAILKANPELKVEHKGEENTFEYRVQALEKSKGEVVSMWHDIKLYPTPESKNLKICNMINEVCKIQNTLLF